MDVSCFFFFVLFRAEQTDSGGVVNLDCFQVAEQLPELCIFFTTAYMSWIFWLNEMRRVFHLHYNEKTFHIYCVFVNFYKTSNAGSHFTVYNSFLKKKKLSSIRSANLS